jgi:hypothetical protein
MMRSGRHVGGTGGWKAAAVRRRGHIGHLERHPNVAEILGVLSRLPQIGDEAMVALADGWTDSPRVAQARDRALDPASPLVLEVLAAFDALGSLYADDLAGGRPYVLLAPATTERGLKAARDALAGAYARPALSRRDHALLLRPWRRVYADVAVGQPDLGAHAGEVTALLDALGALAARCHDAVSAERWDRLDTAALCIDAEDQRGAAERAWRLAVDAGKRRSWTLVRRSAAEALSRPCLPCRRRPQPGDGRVVRLGMDAACGLLVFDALDARASQLLVEPVSHLVTLRPRSLD